jgi:hypothetical protein
MNKRELMQRLRGILDRENWLTIDGIYRGLGIELLWPLGDTRRQQAPRIRAALKQMEKDGVVETDYADGRTANGNNPMHCRYRLR